MHFDSGYPMLAEADNSNSGMDIRTAEKALKYAQEEEGRIVMVLGEEAKEVCEDILCRRSARWNRVCKILDRGKGYYFILCEMF